MKDVGESVEKEFLTAYDELHDALFRHSALRLSDRERAKDVTQETFTRCWEYIAEGNTIENMKAFLYRTLHNLIVDEYRRRGKKEDSLDALADVGFDPGFDGKHSIEVKAEYRIALESLSHLIDAHREVLLLRYVDDLSVSEIAKLLGESPNTVSVRIHRAIKELQDTLAIEKPHAS